VDNQTAMEYDLTEAMAEISRHHDDFEKIQKVLREWELKSDAAPHRLLIRDIRNIVG
jgi:hypothetical protein